MKTRTGFLALAGVLLAVPGRPQEEGTRALWDSTFVQARPPAHKPAPAVTKVPPASRIPAAVEPAPDALVGVTVWRLRRSSAADETGTRILVHAEKGDEEWTPERVSANAPLLEGQRFRFSIESARAGYLYVVDREQYADGSFGEPYLLFPTLKIRAGNNKVAAGTVIEIPSWDDQPPYVWLKRSRPDHVAEVLTILVAPEPLPEVQVSREPLRLDSRRVAEWERRWGAQVKRLESRAQEGKAYTVAEKAAGAGAQVLTPIDPAPQTLFLVEAKSGEALLVSVPLRIRK